MHHGFVCCWPLLNTLTPEPVHKLTLDSDASWALEKLVADKALFLNGVRGDSDRLLARSPTSWQGYPRERTNPICEELCTLMSSASATRRQMRLKGVSLDVDGAMGRPQQ